MAKVPPLEPVARMARRRLRLGSARWRLRWQVVVAGILLAASAAITVAGWVFFFLGLVQLGR